MNGSPHKDHGATTTARVVRALVAGTFVIGIAALLATQHDLHPVSDPQVAVDRAPAQNARDASADRVPDDPRPSLAERFSAP